MSHQRTELHREVVEALVSSKALNFEAVGTVLSKYGSRAALAGDSIGVVINWRVMDVCIPVDWQQLLAGINIERNVGGQMKG